MAPWPPAIAGLDGEAMVAQRTLLPAGRWHFHHGPMDIVIGADGDGATVEAAHARAWMRFQEMLDELAQELPALRRRVHGDCPLLGPIARRMWRACLPHSESFITPMAAVAGSVAQELIACYWHDGVTRAWVNNGGDIALHLAPAQSLRVGLYADLACLELEELRNGVTTDGHFEVTDSMPVRGVATSGWRGRSFSMGIADSVTVLARTAAQADAAATVIANAVNIDDARIVRQPACELKDDTDLGCIPVTVDVPPLQPRLVQKALRAGLDRAQKLREDRLIWSAVLVCQNQIATTDAANMTTTRSRRALADADLVFA